MAIPALAWLLVMMPWRSALGLIGMAGLVVAAVVFCCCRAARRVRELRQKDRPGAKSRSAEQPHGFPAAADDRCAGQWHPHGVSWRSCRLFCAGKAPRSR
jgi:hypothetical protein